jgi:hypothetical protein
MPIITPTDLEACLYPEVIAEVTRDENALTERAIATAEQEAKMYLGRYDLTALFGTESAAPTVNDAYLKSIVQHLACWHLLRLSNTGVDYGVLRTAYQDAVSALKTIMTGQAQPDGWPYADVQGGEVPADGNSINWSSNPRRNHFY